MPGMPRTSEKGKKIAFKILGEPVNMQKQNQPKDNMYEKKLNFEEQIRIK